MPGLSFSVPGMTALISEDTLNLPVTTFQIADKLSREAELQQARKLARLAAYAAGEDVGNPDEEEEDEIKRLSWAEIGMLAFIESRGNPSVKELESFAHNGVEGMRHLLRKLRKRGLVKLTRHLNSRKQFTGGTYSIVKQAA